MKQFSCKYQKLVHIIWRFIFFTSGIILFNGNSQTVFAKCRSVFYAIVQIFTSLYCLILGTTDMIQSKSSIITLSVFLTTPICIIQILTSLYFLCKRQYELSPLFSTILDHLSAKNIKKSFRFLCILLVLEFLALVFVVAIELEEYYSDRSNHRNESYGIESYLSSETGYNSTMYYVTAAIVFMWILVCYAFNNSCKILFIYVTYLLSLHFKSLEHHVNTMDIHNSMTLMRTLKNLHNEFDKLSGWSHRVSHGFSPILLFWFAGDLAIICFGFRALQANFVIINPFIPYVVHDSCMLLMITKFAGDVYVHAKDSASAINALIRRYQNPQTASKNVQREICIRLRQMLFMQELDLKSVGIDVNGVFVMTRTTIISVIGTVLTYVVVLYQTP